MKSAQKYVLSALFAVTTLAGNTSAWAHAGLQTSTPEKDAEIAAAPKEVTLQFNEKLESAFSTAKCFWWGGSTASAGRGCRR